MKINTAAFTRETPITENFVGAVSAERSAFHDALAFTNRD